MTTPTAEAPSVPESTTARPKRRIAGRVMHVIRLALIVLLVCCAGTLLVSYTGGTAAAACVAATDDQVLAGAAKADITPTEPVYLGGYGVGPVRLSTGALQPLYVRALALRASDNIPAHTLAFAAIDSQGYFADYQSGPYGIDDIRATLAKQLGLAADHIIITSTHSHAAPDTIGFWGGVPDSYLRVIHDQAVSAITQAVAALAPARLSVGTSSIAGYTSSFDQSENGNATNWPSDTQLRELRAVSSNNGHTLATLINISVHPTSLGASNTLAAPDWPGVTANTVEQHLGGTAIVMIGALGHTWPGFPKGTPDIQDHIASMQAYAAQMSDSTISATQHERGISDPTLCVADRHFRQLNTTAPLMMGLQLFGGRGQAHVMRANTPPSYIPPNIIGVEVEAVRIGDIAFYTLPVEPYPSLLIDLRGKTKASTTFIFGLANDQLGYATEPGEYLGAVANSPTDEALFIIDPGFGQDLVHEATDAGRDIGLAPTSK